MKSLVEKLFQKGIDSITDAELVGLCTGMDEEMGRELLKEFGTLRRLSQATPEHLLQTDGVTRKRAAQLVAGFEFSRRKELEKELEKTQRMVNSTTSYAIFSALYADRDRENFGVMYLNRNNEIMKVETLFVGGVASTIIDVRVVVKNALLMGASAVICSHNHPSGALIPSRADKEITRKLSIGLEYMDISLLDHIIVSHRGFYSFADEGEML